MALYYRDAVTGDEKDILELIEMVLAEYNLNLEPNGADQDVTDLNSHYFNNGGWFQVVINNNKVIGSVGIYKVNDEECELRKMYLLNEYQNKGIGTQLLKNAIKKASEEDFSYMTLQTNSVLKKALPLYKKFGFTEDNSIEVCSRCDIAMILNLDK